MASRQTNGSRTSTPAFGASMQSCKFRIGPQSNSLTVRTRTMEKERTNSYTGISRDQNPDKAARSMKQIMVLEGNITPVKAEGIVNATSSTELGGGGVDGSIQKLLDE